MSHQLLNEGLRRHDLVHLVADKIHFDEYESKMGDPEDVITVSFKVKQRMPAQDLVSFIENGYDWVLDVDVSTGEINDGEFLVFVEVARKSKLAKNINELLEDLHHLTDVAKNNWKFKWYKQKNYYDLTEETISDVVPMTPKKYKEFMEQYDTVKQDEDNLVGEIDKIKKLSGIG